MFYVFVPLLLLLLQCLYIQCPATLVQSKSECCTRRAKHHCWKWLNGRLVLRSHERFVSVSTSVALLIDTASHSICNILVLLTTSHHWGRCSASRCWQSYWNLLEVV